MYFLLFSRPLRDRRRLKLGQTTVLPRLRFFEQVVPFSRQTNLDTLKLDTPIPGHTEANKTRHSHSIITEPIFSIVFYQQR